MKEVLAEPLNAELVEVEGRGGQAGVRPGGGGGSTWVGGGDRTVETLAAYRMSSLLLCALLLDRHGTPLDQSSIQVMLAVETVLTVFDPGARPPDFSSSSSSSLAG